MGPRQFAAKAWRSALVLSAAMLSTSNALAQVDGNAGNPTLLAAIKQVQASVASLQTQLNQVSTNVSALSSLQAQVTQITTDVSVLSSLQTAVNQIATDVAALSASASGNRVVTPAVFAAPGASVDNFVLCNLANVSASSKHVQIDAVRGKDQVVFPIKDGSQAFPAGFADGFPPNLGGQSGFFYCRFTVLDGVASDIRGTIESLNSGTGGGNLAVPAN